MAESLISLRKNGGNVEVPAWQTGSADITETFTVAAGATHNTTVTKKPRYILLYRTVHNSSNDYGICCIYDIEADSGAYIALGSGGPVQGISMTAIFGNITSSVVQVKGPGSGTSSYTFAMSIWY